MVRCPGHGKVLSAASGVFWRCFSALPGDPSRLAPPHGLSMLAKLASYTLVGIDATPVEVEVDVSFSSMPKTVLVGLAETAVKESTAPGRACDRRLGVPTGDRSCGHQPRAGRLEKRCRRV